MNSWSTPMVLNNTRKYWSGVEKAMELSLGRYIHTRNKNTTTEIVENTFGPLFYTELSNIVEVSMRSIIYRINDQVNYIKLLYFF